MESGNLCLNKPSRGFWPYSALENCWSSASHSLQNLQCKALQAELGKQSEESGDAVQESSASKNTFQDPSQPSGKTGQGCLHRHPRLLGVAAQLGAHREMWAELPLWSSSSGMEVGWVEQCSWKFHGGTKTSTAKTTRNKLKNHVVFARRRVAQQ